MEDKQQPQQQVEETFEEYMRNARDEFVMAVKNEERSNFLLTAIDSFLICFDQMREKLTASPLPASSSIEGQKEESQSAEEFAEGMMGLGKFDPKTWHHADAMLYNIIVKSVRYGAGEYSKLKECHDGLKADLERCKLVASSEIIKLRQSLNDISLYNNGFIEYFRQHNYRLMYDLWKRVYGIATAYSTPPTISKEDEQ